MPQKKEHGEAIRWLSRYILQTRDKGTILTPSMDTDIEVDVDDDCAINYDSKDTQSRDTARSRYGYIVMYKGCRVS